MVAKAALSGTDTDEYAIWASEDCGVYVHKPCLFGNCPGPVTIVTYDAFIDWATTRETELVEYVVGQL